jgi:hypothetical protein
VVCGRGQRPTGGLACSRTAATPCLAPEPRVPRLAHGLPAQRNIAHAFGNAISPLLGATFITNAIEALRDAENSDRLYNPLEVVS